MRKLALIILISILFLGSSAQAEELTLEQVTTNPSVGFGLHEDLRLTLYGKASSLMLPNLAGQDISVGQLEARASAGYRFWDEFKGNDVFIEFEGRGRASSDVDGIGGKGGLDLNNGYGNGHHPLDLQEMTAMIALGLYSRPDTIIQGTDLQVAWHLRGGIGATWRHLIEQETLFSCFAEVDLSIRPKSSYVGGFIAGSFDFSLEPGGHVARMDWELKVGPELVTTTLLRRVRLYGMASRMNYGVLYEDSNGSSSEELDAIVLSQVFLGGGASAQLGPVEIFVEAGHTRHLRLEGDLISNESFRQSTSAFQAQLGLRAQF